MAHSIMLYLHPPLSNPSLQTHTSALGSPPPICPPPLNSWHSGPPIWYHTQVFLEHSFHQQVPPRGHWLTILGLILDINRFPFTWQPRGGVGLSAVCGFVCAGLSWPVWPARGCVWVAAFCTIFFKAFRTYVPNIDFPTTDIFGMLGLKSRTESPCTTTQHSGHPLCLMCEHWHVCPPPCFFCLFWVVSGPTWMTNPPSPDSLIPFSPPVTAACDCKHHNTCLATEHSMPCDVTPIRAATPWSLEVPRHRGATCYNSAPKGRINEGQGRLIICKTFNPGGKPLSIGVPKYPRCLISNQNTGKKNYVYWIINLRSPNGVLR